MFDLDQERSEVRLLNWNAELPSSGTNDPLGLTLRVGARLAAELSHCITSITPRARYYSFFPWAFERARIELGEKASLNELLRRVILHERAMLLGAVLHHEGQTCEGGALQGSTPAALISRDPSRDPISLGTWQHLQATEGGFAAYKGSLINLGLFLDPDGDLETASAEEVEEDEAQEDRASKLTTGHLSKKGERLAKAFGEAVAHAAYLETDPSTPVDFETLRDFGGRAGLCELRDADPFDLPSLRDLFFAQGVEGTENSDFRRRMTLLLILQLAQAATESGAELTGETFSDLTFYRRLFPGDNGEVEVDVPADLEDIAERWRIFHFHTYLTTALESLLAAAVRSLRGHPGGLSIRELVDSFGTPETDASLSDCLSIDIPKPFLEMTASEALAAVGLDVAALVDEPPSTVGHAQLSRPLEKTLRSLLSEGGLVSGSAGPALATLLLYVVLLRFQATVSENHQGWNRHKVLDTYNDVSVPGVLHLLQSHFGASWWDRTNRDLLDYILGRLVVRQHEAMSYARGFGGSPPLFHLSGERVVGNDLTRDDVDPGNARFPSLMQILWDLRFLGGDSGRDLTEDGKEFLASQIQGALM